MFSKRGYSPIHLAAYYGQTSIIEYLVKNQSVDINVKAINSGNGLTPLHSAVKGCFKDRNPKFKETIDMLIELGADSTNAIGETAKQYAMDKLLHAFSVDYENFKDYDILVENFESCDGCEEKKKVYKRKLNLPLDGYWSNFKTIFIECNECFQNFKNELRCYHSTW